MAMSDASATLRAAIAHLYAGTPQQQQQANEWLNTFSKQPEAWSTALDLLDPQQSPECSFFCANMLLTKVRAEWHKLSDEQRTHISNTARCAFAMPQGRPLGIGVVRGLWAGVSAHRTHGWVADSWVVSSWVQQQVPAAAATPGATTGDAAAGAAAGGCSSTVRGAGLPGVCWAVPRHGVWRGGAAAACEWPT